MLVVKARKLCLQKYANPVKIKKINQSYTMLYLDPQILSYILVWTIYPWGLSKETTNDIIFKIPYYIMERYYAHFAKLILKYMIKVCNISLNFPSPHSNLLSHIFKAFQVSLEQKNSPHQWEHT